jgi:hypothetical protein
LTSHLAGHSYGGQFARRMGAVTVEVPSSHVAMVSHPGEVAQLIKDAASAVTTD